MIMKKNAVSQPDVNAPALYQKGARLVCAIRKNSWVLSSPFLSTCLGNLTSVTSRINRINCFAPWIFIVQTIGSHRIKVYTGGHTLVKLASRPSITSFLLICVADTSEQAGILYDINLCICNTLVCEDSSSRIYLIKGGYRSSQLSRDPS